MIRISRKSGGFVPPAAVANAAKRGLEYRRKATKSNKGGLSNQQAAREGVGSGVQRAVNLKNRSSLSLKTVKRMNNFFSRHQKNKSIGAKHKGKPWNDKGHVAWLLWGGDPGWAWAKKIIRQEEARKKEARQVRIAKLVAIGNERNKNIKELLHQVQNGLPWRFRLYFVDNKSKKFWGAQGVGRTGVVEITYGRIGTHGTTIVKDWSYTQNKLQEKLKKGYTFEEPVRDASFWDKLSKEEREHIKTYLDWHFDTIREKIENDSLNLAKKISDQIEIASYQMGLDLLPYAKVALGGLVMQAALTEKLALEQLKKISKIVPVKYLPLNYPFVKRFDSSISTILSRFGSNNLPFKKKPFMVPKSIWRKRVLEKLHDKIDLEYPTSLDSIVDSNDDSYLKDIVDDHDDPIIEDFMEDIFNATDVYDIIDPVSDFSESKLERRLESAYRKIKNSFDR